MKTKFRIYHQILTALIMFLIAAFTFCSCGNSNTKKDASDKTNKASSAAEELSSALEKAESIVEDATSTVLDSNEKQSVGSNGLIFKTNSKDESTCSLKGVGTCTDTTIIIPEYSPDGLKVTEIASNAFLDCKELPDKIVIPNTVEKINDWLFALNSGLGKQEFILEFGNSVKRIHPNFLSIGSNYTDHTIIHVIYHGTEEDFGSIISDMGAIQSVGGRRLFQTVCYHYVIEGDDFTYKYYVESNGTIINE